MFGPNILPRIAPKANPAPSDGIDPEDKKILIKHFFVRKINT